MIARTLRATISLLLCFLMMTLPAIAREVCFESENSNPALHSQLKPYCIAARKRVEEVWDAADPRNGDEVQLIFTIGHDGELLNVFPRTLQPNSLNERAVYAITQCGQFPPLPEGQGTLVVLASFKSQHPSIKVKPETKRMLEDAVVVAALIGLTGLAIYGLLKLDRHVGGGLLANGSNGGYTNPNYHWVQPYYTASGDYVHGHYQTNPNATMFDNWSTQGNINPMTGQPGWIIPTR